MNGPSIPSVGTRERSTPGAPEVKILRIDGESYAGLDQAHHEKDQGEHDKTSRLATALTKEICLIFYKRIPFNFRKEIPLNFTKEIHLILM